MSDFSTASQPGNVVTGRLLEPLRRHPKRVVFTEGEDLRILQAAALLVEDLGVSSLDRFELLMGLEEEFGIELPEGDQDQMKSVGDIIAYIEKHVAQK